MRRKDEDWIVEEWNVADRDIARVLAVCSRRSVADEMFDLWAASSPKLWIILRRADRVVREHIAQG
ncbi:MAG TPA: hypothetical protein VIJ85_13975 [Rhizomicrobium sp.]